MDGPTAFNPPPIVKIFDYPAAITVLALALVVPWLLFMARRYDTTGGVLTISLLIVVAFIGVVTFCLLFTIPGDEATSAVVGALVLAMGGVIAYWLGKPRNGG